jgi:hypothetical protein
MTKHAPPPKDATPVFIQFRPGMRRLIEDAIGSLVLLLDEIDGDEDFEEDGSDEPSLGWQLSGVGHPRRVRGYDADLEENIGPDDREHDEGENGLGDGDGVEEQWRGEANGVFQGSGCSDDGPVKVLE